MVYWLVRLSNYLLCLLELDLCMHESTVHKYVYGITVPNFSTITTLFSLSLKCPLQFFIQNFGALVTQNPTLLCTTLIILHPGPEGRDKKKEKKKTTHQNLQCSPHPLGTTAPPHREEGLPPSGMQLLQAPISFSADASPGSPGDQCVRKWRK